MRPLGMVWLAVGSSFALVVLGTASLVSMAQEVAPIRDGRVVQFTDITAGLEGVCLSSVTWGDYDNDGDLDILLAGSTGSEHISRVYESDDAPASTSAERRTRSCRAGGPRPSLVS